MLFSPLAGATASSALDILDYETKLLKERPSDIKRPSKWELAKVGGTSFVTNLVIGKASELLIGGGGKYVVGKIGQAGTRALGKEAGVAIQKATALTFQGGANLLTGGFYRSTMTDTYQIGRSLTMGNTNYALVKGVEVGSGLAGFYAPKIVSSARLGITALRSKLSGQVLKEVTINEPGRGTVRGYIVENVPIADKFKSGKMLKVKQQVDIRKLDDWGKFYSKKLGRVVYFRKVKKASITKPSTWLDFITGRKAGQFKQMAYKKRGTLILKDTPSQVSDPFTQLMMGKKGEIVLAQVSPGRSAFGRKGTFEVKKVPGSTILRSFSGGVEKGFFLAPPSKSVEAQIVSEKIRAIKPNEKVSLDKVQRLVVSNLRGEIVGGSFSANVLYEGFPRKFKDLDIISSNPRATAERIKGLDNRFSIKQGSNGKYTLSFRGKPVADIVPKNLYFKYTLLPIVPSRTIGGIKVLREDILVKGKQDTIKYGSTKSKLKAKKDLEYLTQAKRLKIKEGTPQAYSYYAGLSQKSEASLYDYLLSRARPSEGRPSITMMKEKVDTTGVERLLKKPVTEAERAEIKNILEAIKRGEYEKEGLTRNDANKLLEKYGGVDKLALHRRLAIALDVPGKIVPGVGALSGLRTEFEAIASIGSKFQRFGNKFKNFLGKGDYQIFLPREKTSFDVIFAKRIQPKETMSEKIARKTKETINQVKETATKTIRQAKEVIVRNSEEFARMTQRGQQMIRETLRKQASFEAKLMEQEMGKLSKAQKDFWVNRRYEKLFRDYLGGTKKKIVYEKVIVKEKGRDPLIKSLIGEKVSAKQKAQEVSYYQKPVYSPRKTPFSMISISPKVSKSKSSKVSRASRPSLISFISGSSNKSISKSSSISQKSGKSVSKVSQRSPFSLVSGVSYKSPTYSPPPKKSGGSSSPPPSPPPSKIRQPPSSLMYNSSGKAKRTRRSKIKRRTKNVTLPTLTEQLYVGRPPKGSRAKVTIRGFEWARFMHR
jgi:hypothetical protein